MSQEVEQQQHFANLSSIRGTLQQPNIDTEDGLNQNIKMQDGVDKPDAGEATAQTKTDPDEVDFEGLSTLDEPVSETIVSTLTSPKSR